MDGFEFGFANYAILLTMLLISSSIGIYFRFTGGRQKTTSEYLFADGQMSAVPLAFSLMSSFISAVTLLGVSAESYSFGTMFATHSIAYGLSTPIVAYVFVPVYFKLGVNNVYEYLERRFGRVARICGSVAFTLQMILYMGVALYAPALALETITSMQKSYAILLVGLVCTFYSALGGLKAVIFTDVFQSLMMYGAVFSVVTIALIEKGSFAEIWHIATAHGRIEFNNFDLDPTVRHTWWGVILGGSVTYLSVYAVNQGQIQRYMSTGDLKTAQRAILINWPLISLMSLSTSFAGLCIFAKYARCDPFTSCKISRSDQLMPYFVMDTMKNIPGLPGLFVSGIFSAALSTVSAAMNSLAVVTLEDYLKPIYRKVKGKDFPEQQSLYAKLLSVMYGLVCIIFAFMADRLGGVLQASLTILGVVGGPTFGLFTLGMVFPHVQQKGAVSGYIIALVFTFWIGFADKPSPTKLPGSLDGCFENEYGNSSLPTECFVNVGQRKPTEDYFYLYQLSYMWLSFLGFIICLLVGNIVSWLECNRPQKKMDPDMFISPISCSLKKQYFIEKENERLEMHQRGGTHTNDSWKKEEEEPCLKPKSAAAV